MSRWIALAGATMVAGLCLPGSAAAGTYTWAMPHDFTAAPPGSNPDRDSYGGTPWRYTVYDGSNAAPLEFSTALGGGLSGWSDGGQGFVAENSSGSAIGGIPPGALAMRPPPGGTAMLSWESPLSGSVSVTGSVTPGGSGGCRFVWALSSGGTIIASGASDGATAVSATPAVAPATVLQLYVQPAGGSYSPSCDTAVVSLTITAAASAPSVTVTSPAAGTTVNGQPAFAGRAGGGFGVSGTVTLRVYGGSSVGASPAETLSPTVSGGAYETTANPPLPSGTYTVQAEQDDLAGDRGLSAPVTFTVRNVPPVVRLNPVTAAFTTSTPALTGTAGTSSEDQNRVYLGLYAGPAPAGKLVRLVSGPRAANGAFSISVTPGLPDGFYTVVAGQGSLGGNGFSAPLVIEVKMHPPALTLDQPGNGTAINAGSRVFSGSAGDAAGDYPTLKLVLYSGPVAIGKPFATRLVQAKGSAWSYTWPRDLPVGFYSAIVEQADNAGHIVTRRHSFLVTVLPHVIGYVLSLDRKGRVSIRITCPAEAGFCVGDVLAVTSKPLQPVRGGPVGPVRLLFVHVRIRAGQTSVVSRRLAGAVATTLRRGAPMQVRVGAILKPTDGRQIRLFRERLLNAG